MVRITFLGTSGAGGVPGRAQNCTLLETSDNTILLDAGPGCGARLRERGLSACDIDAVYVSHLHLDHWSGIFDLAVQAIEEHCRFPTIVVPDEVLDNAARVLTESLPRSIVDKARITRLSESPLSDKARLVKSQHAVPCYGVIISDKDVVVYYSSDTALNKNLVSVIKEADIAIVEATLPSGLEDVAIQTGHMTISQAISLKDHMRPGSLLVLTHFSEASMKELTRLKKAPRGVVVPYDHTVLFL